jgi:glycosyltransferase involved in cell wall biosynthesis
VSDAVAFILKGYPRLSETFIAQEILALERRGLDIRLFSLRHPTEQAIHPVHREIKAPVTYLPEYLHHEPLRVLRAWWSVRRRAGYARARSVWLGDLARDRTINRIRRFGQALVLAHEFPTGVAWLHAHFMHTPASVTRYAANILDMPWSISAHAKDIWTTAEWEKREKLAECQWLVTCTAANAGHLAGLAADPNRVELVYHGLDLERFPPPRQIRLPRDGSRLEDPVVILSVGRAVEKKGYDVLLDALNGLPEQLNWMFVHIGNGPLLATLKAKAEKLGQSKRITWLGALPQEQVLKHYRQADLFVLAARVASDGDRDGLPNVLLEAQSQGLPCVSTRLSAIPELIVDGETGVLVAPDDPQALSTALRDLIISPQLRVRLGAKALKRIHAAFSHDRLIGHLAARFGIEEEQFRACASPSTRR